LGAFIGHFSSIAEIIVGHAISEAKRYDCEIASELHLLSAVRRWQEEQFDARFPNVSRSVLAAMSLNRGNSIKRPVLKQELETRMLAVNSPESVWVLAESLIQETKDQRNTVGTSHSKIAAVEAMSENGPSREQTKSTSAELSQEEDRLPFGINENLIDRIAAFAKTSPAETANKILNDAHYVAQTVIGRETNELFEMIELASGLTGNTPANYSDLSNFVNQLSLLPDPSASKYATQVSMALVEVAEWAASIDEDVTKEEIDRIDGIRLALREQLGDRIDTESAATIAFESKFENLIGMEAVKTDLRKRLDFLVVNRRRQKRGLKADVHRMHMAFLGNPGTGKTTVARLFGELLNELGLLPTKKFIETDRSGLVGEYIGHSEKKTLNVVEEADGGVLFVDEAYALDDGYQNQKGFGYEATSVLVKQMEDRRDRLVVILAGYTQPTVDYIAINPGLKSRIPTTINFPDYSIEDLKQIALHISAQRDLILDEASLKKIVASVGIRRGQVGFGNAREIENMLEHAQRSSINRLSKLGNLATEIEIKTILPEDIPNDPISQTKKFGFNPTPTE
jgi:stage V sporulation protein K